MLAKEITYTNFNDEEVTVKKYFNLSKTEAMRLVNGHGGMDTYLQEVADKKDNEKLIDFVEELVLAAYGRRDENDPEVFDKSDEAKKEFKASPAFDELVYTLLTNEKEFVDFFYGILPKSLREQALAQNPQLMTNV